MNGVDRLVQPCCGYDYCVCGQYRLPRVPTSSLPLDVQRRHLETVLATVIKARAPQSMIRKCERELAKLETT